MATNDVWKLTLTGVAGASTAQSTGFFRCKTATPEPNTAALATLATAFMNAFRPWQGGYATWRTWKAVQVRASSVSYTARPCLVTGGRGEEGTFTSGNTGQASAADPLPPQCALVVTLKTSLVGRSRRGRVYGWGLSENDQASGIWSTTKLGEAQTAWDAFLAIYRSNPAGTDPLWEYGVWSHRIASGCVPRNQPPWGLVNQYPPNPDDAFTGINSAVVKSTVHTQRRRVVGVGI